jgi:Bifunctional DNA primase/polymerase, N-terminal
VAELGGKRPALRGDWQEHATTNQNQLRAWWSRAPYNIGIACGPSGLVVIDLDVPRQTHPSRPVAAVSGADSLAALCIQHERPRPLPTYAVGTPSGGCHLYYAADGARIRNSAGRRGPLIDVRADGGYVIAEGSRIGERRYTVCDDHAPAPLAEWIADLLKDRPSAAAGAGLPVPYPGSAQGTAYAMAAVREETRRVATARPGTRNDTLNRAAFNLGQLAAAGLLPPLAVVTGLASAAERAGLPEDEALRTIRSGLDAGARKPRAQ